MMHRTNYRTLQTSIAFQSTVMLSIIAVVISLNLVGNTWMTALVTTVFASNALSRVFLRFDQYYVQFRYVSQPRTCRLCGQTNHLASACHTFTCFNCKKTGHLASDCPGPVYCNICKSPAHQARSCPFSWSCLVNFPVSTLETTSSNTESTTSDNSTND